MSRAVVTAAGTRTFRVLWYEVPNTRSIFSRDSPPRPMPKLPIKRKRVLEVKARSLDVAKRLAREVVTARGVQVVSVNFTQRPDELIVYSKEPT